MITNLKLENFKCFKEIELSLGYLNLLSGINSMGKSSIIQSLLLLRQSYERDSSTEGVFLNGNYVSLGNGIDLNYFNNETDENSIIIKANDDCYEWKMDFSQNADYIQFIKKPENSMLQQCSLFNDSFEYVVAERLGPRKSYEKSFYDAQIKNHLGIHGEFTVHYLDKQRRKKVLQNMCLDDDRSLKHQVELWMNYITPGIQLEFLNNNESDTINLKIQHYEEAGDMSTMKDYKPVNVGFGISYVLPVIVALLKASENDLVILENPEAHLHPRGQRYIGELISRACQAGIQVLVETHSDHILNGIRLSVKKGYVDKEKVNLFYFNTYREDDVVLHSYEQPHINANGKLDKWPDGFFDEWDKTLMEMLF